MRTRPPFPLAAGQARHLEARYRPIRRASLFVSEPGLKRECGPPRCERRFNPPRRPCPCFATALSAKLDPVPQTSRPPANLAKKELAGIVAASSGMIRPAPRPAPPRARGKNAQRRSMRQSGWCRSSTRVAARIDSAVFSKQRDRYLRSLFVAGALSVIRRAKIHDTKHRPWLTALLARRPTKVAAIALANKLARVAWAMLAKGKRYKQPAALAA